LNAEEFVNFVNQSIAPEASLRRITIADVHNWTNKGLFKSAPNSYRYDIQTALALLQLEREGQAKSIAEPQYVQPRQANLSRTRDLEATLRKGIAQVVTCVSSYFSEEQRIIKALKDTGLISSAGHVVVNFYPFSSKPIKIPSDGVEANEGNALVFETDGLTLLWVTTGAEGGGFTSALCFEILIIDHDKIIL
jgi:hypothetical protein